jgi:hypothetical protein
MPNISLMTDFVKKLSNIEVPELGGQIILPLATT